MILSDIGGCFRKSAWVRQADSVRTRSSGGIWRCEETSSLRSADFQSAVSQSSALPGAGMVEWGGTTSRLVHGMGRIKPLRPGRRIAVIGSGREFSRLADWKSAIQQSGNSALPEF
jgi:hypothetical protein